MKLAVTIAALLFAAAPAHAYCALDLRYENGAIRWNRIDGATEYSILEAYGRPAVYRHFTTLESSFAVSHRATVATSVRYTVTAIITPGVRGFEGETNDACAGTILVDIPADEAFRKMTRRAILPVVGSTAGAFGGKFKTSLVLRPFGEDQRGRLVFHPAGRVASDSDPSIPYSFPRGAPVVFDDVVAAIGQSGIGSLDIIPDDDASSFVPRIEARLFNDASVGTFGTLAGPAYPFDYLRAPAFEIVIPEDGRSRINIGFRALTDISIRIFVFNELGTLLSFHDVTYPAGWMQMTSAADFVGKPLTAGQRVQVVFTGSAIPFHTVTENSTNDPTLVVTSPRASSRNVGEYID